MSSVSQSIPFPLSDQGNPKFGREQKKERKKTHHFVIEAYITLASLFTYLLGRNFASFVME